MGFIEVLGSLMLAILTPYTSSCNSSSSIVAAANKLLVFATFIVCHCPINESKKYCSLYKWSFNEDIMYRVS